LLTLAMLLGGAIPAGAQFNTLLGEVPKLTGVSEILLLQSLDDGSTIFSKEEYRRTAPASLTKITTAILVLEHCKDLNEVVEVKPYCISMFHGRSSSNAGIKTGEELTVEELLYCMLLNSANEASAILADHVAGSVDEFVVMMNDFARERGCVDTQFMNPHGLDEEGHYTTAADIALITRYALSREFSGNAVFEKITGTLSWEVPETNKTKKRSLLNTNRMLNRYHPDYYMSDVSGVKTGNTDQAGDCIAARASRAGFSYLCIVMRGKKAVIPPKTYSVNTAFTDAKALLEWAFVNIKMRQVTETDKAVAEIPVEMARSTDRVQLVPKETLFAFVPDGVNSGNVLIEPIPEKMPASITAPVTKGQLVGRARILYAGAEFTQVDLVAAEDIGRSATMYFVSLARDFVRTPAAKGLLFAVILAAGIYLGVLVLQSRRKSREKQLRVVPGTAAEHRSGAKPPRRK